MARLRSSAFLKRLRTELPVWVERGWVPRKHQRSIVDYVTGQEEKSPRYLVAALALMGALLLGAGVITFFAANWGAIPKLVKLVILFGALGGSYAAAGYCQVRNQAALAQGLLLLGVVLFGANVFLIAQIYHIDAHYPNGILLWTAGALATAALGYSQPALVAALALATLWSATETFEFGRAPHWSFFIPWSLALWLVYRHRWFIALRTACWSLLAWCLLLLLAGNWSDRQWTSGEQIALLQVYVFAGIALYILGRGMAWHRRWYAPPVITAGAVWAVAALFALAFPRLQRDVITDPAASLSVWAAITVAVLVLVAALMAWRYWNTRLSTLPLYRQGAFLWLIVAGAFALANLFTAGRYSAWAALGYNLLAFAGVVWLVMTGADRGEPRVVNLGFAFFAALLLARYFDTFWTLLDRSYFFMVGGALLLLAGFFIERSRRRLTARIAARGEA